MSEREQRARQRLKEIGEAIEHRAETAELHEVDDAIADSILMLDAWAIEFPEYGKKKEGKE